MIIKENGFYDLSNEDYHKDFCETPSLSSGMCADLLSKTEYEAFLNSQRLNPNYQRGSVSKACDLGSIIHEYILEGKSPVLVAPFDDWRTKDSKAWRAEHEQSGKIILNKTEYSRIEDKINGIMSALREQIDMHTEYPEALKDFEAEKSGFYFDGKIWNRARFDIICKKYPNVLFDLKTTELDIDQWIRTSLFNTGYVQSEHYRKVYKGLTGIDTEFVYIFVQTKEPYNVVFITLDASISEDINMRYELARNKFINCLNTGNWRRHPPYTIHAYPPAYVLKDWEEQAINLQNLEG